jgi:LysM repeat protein
MNNPSPLIPQGSLVEQKSHSRSRLKTAFFCVVGVHVAVVLVALLVQGCRREQPAPPPEEVVDTPVVPETNADTAVPPYAQPTYTPATPEATYAPPPPPPPPVVTEYTIQHGDTFTSIGKQFGVSWKAIQDANPGVEPTKLKLGQKIVIPQASAAPATGAAPVTTATGEQIHVVKSGDTLSAIATKYKTTVKAIRSANNLTTDRIVVGAKLVIPAKVESTPAPAPYIPPATTYPAPASSTPSPAQ